MAQINTYSPDGRERLCVQYDRDGAQVMVGAQRAIEPKVTVNGEDAPGVTTSTAPTFDDLGGTWMSVDRAGVNNLIRSLREARDKAFGRDE